MTAKEWLEVMQQAKDYNPEMTKLIEKYGELYAKQEAIGFYNWQILVGEDSEFMYQHLDDSPEQLYELYEQLKNKAQ